LYLNLNKHQKNALRIRNAEFAIPKGNNPFTIMKMMKPVSGALIALAMYSCSFQNGGNEASLSEGLSGHWPMTNNLEDASAQKNEGQQHGSLSFVDGAGLFDGTGAWLEIPSGSEISPGTGDFSVATWVNSEVALDDSPGDIISQYDPKHRKGFHLSLKSNASPTSQSSYRQLMFGIDDGKSGVWIDEGRPGNALMAFAMAEYKGELYAGVCQPGKEEYGKVFRYAGKDQWVDCGSPDKSNSVTALAVFDGALYAATGHYRVAGSSLAESENTEPGGRVFRYDGTSRWTEVGQLEGVACIGGLVVYKGQLYASSMYAPSGFFRYEGGNKWQKLVNPKDIRVVNMGVYDGYLYATSWDHGHVYRYDGEDWEDCGLVGDNTQNYAFNIYEGNLYSATWPSGRVFRFDGINQWSDRGRLGTELEVMAMMTYNGKMLGGTLPLAEVYMYEGDTLWTRLDQLDKTPDVKYRRAWAMAEHDGKVFCSTLPSGKIFSYESGKSVSMAESLEGGWQHVAAVKTGSEMTLYVNGKQVAQKRIPAEMRFDLSAETPLKIGFGANDYFKGKLRDVRLYKRALTSKEITLLAVKD
jgi:hypothetical protein